MKFLDLDCVALSNGAVRLLVTESTGPRIIALALADGENILAELPDFRLDCPGEGVLNLWGGHRLWHAPEVQRRTYLPDNRPVTISPIENGLYVLQDTEPQTGLQKALTIQLPDEGATIIIDHQLTNHGLWPVECAPWAITQLKSGGVAVLPQRTVKADPDGLQPNRALAFWTYSDVRADFLYLGNDHIRVRAGADNSDFKIGFANELGWLAYVLGEQLFLKFAAYEPDKPYYDRQSSSQCYCNDRFLELETLGPRATIAPGQSTTHREIWQLKRDPDLVRPDDDLLAVIQRHL